MAKLEVALEVAAEGEGKVAATAWEVVMAVAQMAAETEQMVVATAR